MKTASNPRRPVVGIVGPCTSGKSTLIASLGRMQPFELRHIAQEHSYVQSMWQHITNPDWLIFLDVSYLVSLERKKLNWTEEEYQEQQRRLSHARSHADFYVNTDDLTPEQVTEQVRQFLQSIGLENS